MEKTHFYYTTTKEVPPVKEDKENGVIGTDSYSITEHHSFDIERIVRIITLQEDEMLVLLDDLHERWETRPQIHPKTQKPKFNKKGDLMTERVKDTFQSEIRLTKKQGLELLKIISVNYE